MIYDHRTYCCRPGTIKKQFELYVQGDINSFVHIWAYESAAERERKRAAMQADPDWQAYVQRSGEAGYLIKQENKILMDAPFFQTKK
jgi:hypothetical protein